MKFLRKTLLAGWALGLPLGAGAQAPALTTFPVGPTTVTVSSLVPNLSIVWELVWGPDNFLWMTERNGRISRVNPTTGQVLPLLTVPDVTAVSEAGLLGMVLHPQFAANPYVYVVYTYTAAAGLREKVVRFTYSAAGNSLASPLVLLDDIPAANIHNGARLLIQPDLTLLLATGDAGTASLAQDPASLAGKTLRLNLDGTIPTDNPTPGSYVYSLGHRNPQGLVQLPNGRIYSSEHGPSNDDEINKLEAGRNYGWPNVEGFCDQPGELAFCAANNVREPLTTWTPTIATAGLAYYDHPAIPGWRGSLLLAALRGNRLTQLTLDAAGLTIPTRTDFLTGFGRLRAICVSPEGRVYIGTSNGNDQILVLENRAYDLVVSTAQDVPAGTYNSITVTPTGVATLTGNPTVNQALVVQENGVLNTNCQVISGPGSFELASGGQLGICDAQGIATAGATGAVQVTGTRTFSPEASYVYNGSAPQSTGPGLPAEVRHLTVANAAGLTLTSSGLRVARTLRLTTGNFNPNNLPVRLLSRPDGTALVDNTGGTVTGPVQVERYVDGALNPGLGYRHLSSPVQAATVGELGSGGSPIVVNPAYNAATSTVRPTITPYPTVFAYDESRVPAGNTLADFNEGWVSPATTSEALAVGRGYTVQVASGQLNGPTLTLTGLLNNGALTFAGQTNTTNGPQAGWHLLGNPYPSPLDWSTLTVGTQATANLQNMNGAVYVFRSTGRYAGTYRSYLNGLGGDPLIASGQGFIVRAIGGGQPGTVRLSNANRVTTWSATNSILYRGSATQRPQVRLAVAGAAGLVPDETTVYFEAGATAAPDARYDAYKLRNPGNAASLFSLVGPAELSINGLAPLTAHEVVVPLGLVVPQAGPYTLRAEDLLHLASTAVYLRDAQTGALVNLSQQPAYSFAVPATGLSSTTRFALVFRPATATATRSALDASQVALFPNPARHETTIVAPAGPAASTMLATLLNALGQVVLTRPLPVTSTGVNARLDLRGLPTGVYSLRLTAGNDAPLTKRLVVE